MKVAYLWLVMAGLSACAPQSPPPTPSPQPPVTANVSDDTSPASAEPDDTQAPAAPTCHPRCESINAGCGRWLTGGGIGTRSRASGAPASPPQKLECSAICCDRQKRHLYLEPQAMTMRELIAVQKLGRTSSMATRLGGRSLSVNCSLADFEALASPRVERGRCPVGPVSLPNGIEAQLWLVTTRWPGQHKDPESRVQLTPRGPVDDDWWSHIEKMLVAEGGETIDKGGDLYSVGRVRVSVNRHLGTIAFQNERGR